MSHPFQQYRDTPLWRLLATALTELEASQEVTVSTAPEYVVGYLCQRLDAARLASPTALTFDP